MEEKGHNRVGEGKAGRSLSRDRGWSFQARKLFKTGVGVWRALVRIFGG